MSEKQGKPSVVGKKFKLFLAIFLMLLVPIVMDQAEVDREAVRMAGRIAGGIVIALTLYGLFAKVLKTVVLVILALVALVVLVSEGTVEAPRVKNWFASREK